MSDWKAGRGYDDLIDLPHPVSGTHPQMSARDRAGQFAPFAALTGLEDAIAETARLTDDGPDLSEESKQALSNRLRELRDRIGESPEAEMVWFEPDSRKAGGAYRTLRGRIREIDEFSGQIKLQDGLILPFERLVEIRICKHPEIN